MFQHHLVVDLEATTDRAGFPREDMEIVEIGAVLVEPRDLAPVDEFQTFVRPVVRPRLTAFCTELTTIRQADVDGAPTFPEAIEALRAWLGRRPVQLDSWGDYDRRQLLRDAARHGIRLPFGRGHFNVKEAFAKQARCRPMGVGRALGRVGLAFEGTPHRGIDDARNIARLLPYALGRAPIPP